MRALVSLIAAGSMMAGIPALSAAQPPAAAEAAPSPAPAAQPGPVDARAVVAEVRRLIAANYVIPEKRPALDAVLAEGLRSRRYLTRDPAVLAERINADLERVGRDRHLNFRLNPERAAILAAASGEQPDMAAFEADVRRRAHGIAQLRLLEGNVRYMELRSFEALPDTEAAIDAAMQFLAGGDAVIIDLRENGGGSPRSVHHIISHFMEPDRPLVTFYQGDRASPMMTTMRELRAPRMVGKPLYVLISGTTGSAAEEFTGHVAGYRLGELVGANTSGGAYMNQLYPIAGRFVLSVSTGRAVLASTGRDWEAVGIAPTIAVAPETALEVAHAHALRRLGSANNR
jgi:C-terminal processing protease CtpA/Prc